MQNPQPKLEGRLRAKLRALLCVWFMTLQTGVWSRLNPETAFEGRRPGDVIARGEAPGRGWNECQALQGRHTNRCHGFCPALAGLHPVCEANPGLHPCHISHLRRSNAASCPGSSAVGISACASNRLRYPNNIHRRRRLGMSGASIWGEQRSGSPAFYGGFFVPAMVRFEAVQGAVEQFSRSWVVVERG